MGMGQSAAQAALGIADGAEISIRPGNKTVVSTPAATAQATASIAAGAAGVRHVCTGISIAVACAGTAQTPIRAVLRDGATGAGNILWSKKLSAPANQCASIDISDLFIPGSEATAMTLEFTAGGVAASEEDVTLTYCDLGPQR